MTELDLIKKFNSESIRLSIFISRKFVWLTTEQINFHPLQGKWSVGECFDHLIVSHRMYYDKLAELLRSGKLIHDDKNNKVTNSLFGKILINAVSPDSVRRFNTFNKFKPTKLKIDESVFDKFILLQNKFVKLLNSFENIDFTRTKISSPVSNFIKLNVADALMIIINHNNRHINQAEKIVNLCFFPRDKYKNGIRR